ncbi:MAG: tRNA (adenosine(37)-N6)-dimethylallyltransferase MiaA [Ferruginibacter sp.]|nr:tRNA (adenosine(37)-N6)-dimethylallyltransferase MiaA [Ferruginibacter sp.]
MIILGPTAVGKTAVAIALAKHFSTRIISADSRQCFKELDIGVAKPSPEELQSIHHYFINSHSVHETVNAGIFEKYALDKLREIFETGDIAIMVGGTGLYIKTFCSGMDEVPVILPGIREKITLDYKLGGLDWLQREVQKCDPVYFSASEVQNPQRLMRALEVKLSTGKSIAEFQTQKKVARDFTIIKIGLELPREELYQRINNRVDSMIQGGLPDEVKNLEPYQHLNALQTVGYKELFAYFKEETSLAEATAAIKNNTRHYAKRQMTWFKKEEEVKWCRPDIDAVMYCLMNNFLFDN